MSVIATAVVAAATKVGANIIREVVARHAGPGAGEIAGTLAGTVFDTVADKLGVEPIALPQVAEARPEAFQDAIRETEAQMPELIALWQAGVNGQFALLQAETKEGFWQSFWRYGWMYLLAVFWIWRIIVLPVVNRMLGTPPIEAVEFAVLLTLTSWFMALYMGGHTIKELGKNALDAVRGLKGEK